MIEYSITCAAKDLRFYLIEVAIIYLSYYTILYPTPYEKININFEF